MWKAKQDEAQTGIKIAGRNINNLRHTDDTNLWQKAKNYGKVLKRWEYRTTLPVSWETCMQVKKKQLELYMEQLTGSKLGKEYVKPVYCQVIFYLTYMQLS